MTKGDLKFAKVYKISPINPEAENDAYIGSTCSKSLKERMAKHSYTYRKDDQKRAIYKLFKKYGPDNLKIELVEELNITDKKDLLIAEQRAIDTIPNINKARAYTSDEEKKARRKQLYNERKQRAQEIEV